MVENIYISCILVVFFFISDVSLTQTESSTLIHAFIYVAIDLNSEMHGFCSQLINVDFFLSLDRCSTVLLLPLVLCYPLGRWFSFCQFFLLKYVLIFQIIHQSVI